MAVRKNQIDGDEHKSPRGYKDLTLQQLHSFHAVCSSGGYAPAARELLLTPPALWEQIQALERHYGTALLQRDGNGMRPTAEGERLLELTRPHLAALASTREILIQEQGVWPQSLTVATNLRVFASEISMGLKEFQRRHADILLRLSFLRDDPLLEAVLSGNADIALTLEPGPLGLKPGLRHEIFGEADYLLVTPKKHPLAVRSRFSLPDIVQFPLVLGDAATYSRQRVQEVFHRQHLLDRIRVAVETNSDEYSTNCVRCGLGIAIAVGTASAALYRGLHVRSLRNWFGCVRLCHIRRDGTQLTLAQSELVHHLTASLSK